MTSEGLTSAKSDCSRMPSVPVAKDIVKKFLAFWFSGCYNNQILIMQFFS